MCNTAFSQINIMLSVEETLHIKMSGNIEILDLICTYVLHDKKTCLPHMRTTLVRFLLFTAGL